jgi:hypothetical protein
MRYHISWKDKIDYGSINLDHGFQEVFIIRKKNILEEIHIKKLTRTHMGSSESNSLNKGVTVSIVILKSKEGEHGNRGSFSLTIKFMGDNAT